MKSNPAPTLPALSAEHVSVYYGDTLALDNVAIAIPPQQVVAFIGPSGSGKSTLLRCFNRLNDLIKGIRVTGSIHLFGQDLRTLHPVEVRRRVGMVFQKPNPFPKSIYENIALGLRVNGYWGDVDELVEYSLRQSGLWDEVKNKLNQSALNLSGGQQQRLCIARALALQPEIILMDEPCSALDPISTLKVEDTINELKQHYTILIVTHNLQQAARLADRVAFFDIKLRGEQRIGKLVEYGSVTDIFTDPISAATRAYIQYKQSLLQEA